MVKIVGNNLILNCQKAEGENGFSHDFPATRFQLFDF